jgi:hypothetical protein
MVGEGFDAKTLQLIMLVSTGTPQIDSLLAGFIGLFELAFPARIRAYYLVGSYANGSHVPASARS